MPQLTSTMKETELTPQTQMEKDRGGEMEIKLSMLVRHW